MRFRVAFALLLCFPSGAAATARAPDTEEVARRHRARLLPEPPAGGRAFAELQANIWDASDRVLAASRETRERLGHLQTLARSEGPGELYWDEYRDFESKLLAELARRGLSPGPRLREQLALVGAAMLWHRLQHRYDETLAAPPDPDLRSWAFHESLETERRAWEAGCIFWRAGEGLQKEAGGVPDAFECRGGFPSVYNCKHYLAVELVLLTGAQLRGFGRSVADVERDRGVPIRGRAPRERAFERAFGAYCAELARIGAGDPLSLDGVELRWSAAACVRAALDAVLAPGWRGSTRNCPVEPREDADVRAAVERLRDWR